MSDGPSNTPADGTTRPERRRGIPKPPNYAARRMLVGTGIVTLVFAAAVVGWRWYGGDGSSLDGTGAGWSTIAIVDRITGDVTYADADGAETGTSLGHGRTGSLFAHDGVLALANSRNLTVLPPPGDDGEPLVIDIPGQGTVTPIRTDGGTFLAVGAPTGGGVSLVDVDERALLDIDELAIAASPVEPRMFVETLRSNSDGTMFAIADAANGRTIVVRFAESEPIFLADQPVAVGDDLVATSQTLGLEADIALVALDRSTRAMVLSDIPASSVGVMHDERLTIIAVDEGVYRIEPGDEDAERIGAVAVPTGATIEWVAPTANGERLVVGGATFEAVIDLEGRTLFTTTFASAVRPTPPDPIWTCLPVGGPGGYHSIVDLDSGEQLADLSDVESVDGVAADGCTVVADVAGATVVIGAAGTANLGVTERVVLGPDGASVVRILVDGTTDLVLIDDEMTVGEPIDLTPLANPSDLIAFIPD